MHWSVGVQSLCAAADALDFFFTRTILDTELFLSLLENGFGPGTTEVLYVCTFGCDTEWGEGPEG